ncbi:GNAT family N-acetyltransferase [Edwardsiella piscicida]|uniref:GCN5-related N-acetyltransferase n=3 Tax=Edwardsiella TaxID=635 RepID=A0A0H3DR56_EDWTF|nr:GNAT family N-acetyltransferase [Edwardsiella piscicida]ACY84784.1 putative acetyltransferase [Edwardsiella tarda EIB202]ADM41865.1 GCN5-related N-acetyltransferase [Edwardsiella tarda FL6-60]AGH73900.1 N-acetyltransferase GCN5 [Edwardsiella piscicida C07-087]AOP43196.1 GNAT family N-acetyltransferase [Edwardsiella piscicida]ARD19751.1 N-acetyltransferase [Edwardsiella piscicida]
MSIYPATPADAERINPLFIAYRQFYDVPSDPAQTLRYLQQRLTNAESVIFYAVDTQGECVGFTQLYPLFCSLEMKPTWLLYDLFVAPQARRHGVARALMQRAEAFARDGGAAFIGLDTGTDNTRAQALYEEQGYLRDRAFYHYQLTL